MPIKWDAKTLRYRGDAGRFVKREAVTTALEKARTEVKSRLVRLGQQLKGGQINAAQFAISFRDEIKALHVLAGGIARGGKAQLSPAALGRIGADTRKQYEFANRLVRQVVNGRQPMDGNFFRRLRMYADASRGTFAEGERRMHRDAGFEGERNVINSSESCEECLAEASKGVVAIGSLKPIGSRRCKTNCLCRIVFEKAA